MAKATRATKGEELVDASLNPAINGVRLPDGRVVAWAVAFPRPEFKRKGNA